VGQVEKSETQDSTDTQNNGRTITSYNPATGEPIDSVPIHSEDDVNEAVARAHAAQNDWKERSLSDRAGVLKDFRDLLVDRRMEMARLLTEEVGKPTIEALTQEVAMAAELATYYANNAPEVLAPKRISHRLLKSKRSKVVREPKGVVGVITPWNYPLVLTTQSILAAFVAGNAVVNKPSEVTPLTSLKLEEFLADAGLPEDLFQVVTGEGETGAALVNADVQHISFTGSVATGRKIASRCGERLISSTMELGGKDAAIVLEDAPMERTISGLTWGAFTNAGQICASMERVYVHESRYDELIDGIVEEVESLRLGPGNEEVDVGPMAMEDQRDIVEEQVDDARKKGAKVLTGGRKPDRPGNFYEPTVLVDVQEDMKVIREETFGPLLPIFPVQSVDEAVERVNDSEYGLTASIWTGDTDYGEELAHRIEAGSVYINDHVTPQGGPEVPWGGVKNSGVGRTRGEEGLLEMTEAKHISVERLNLNRDVFWFPYTEKAARWFDRIFPWPFKWWLGG
jgi:succinate-semialdehyde dehydrogenase/glutarate-semialdehyde dehydrogenase